MVNEISVKEERFLHQIRTEELYGPITSKGNEEIKKSLAPNKAAIPFTYSEIDESATTVESSSALQPEDGEDSDDSGSDLDLGMFCLFFLLRSQFRFNKMYLIQCLFEIKKICCGRFCVV